MEKLRLCVYYTNKAKCAFLKEAIAMPRCSSACVKSLFFNYRFFDSSRVSCIDKLKINYYRYVWKQSRWCLFMSWIDSAVKRKIQHLHGCCFLFEMPISLYICETLVSLKLYGAALVYAEFVSLPCLKILHLTATRYPNEATFERLVSSCPVLEELEIKGRFYSEIKVLRVLSRSLKRLTTRLGFALQTSDSGIVIDAPRLCFLRIDDNLSESFIITNIKLESFPNLKSLILVFSNEKMPSEEMNQISFSSVPECLLSSLEFVDFKVPISGLAAETNLVRYFFENSAILKKLTLPLNYHAIQHNFGKKLLKIPRRSTECKVVFL